MKKKGVVFTVVLVLFIGLLVGIGILSDKKSDSGKINTETPDEGNEEQQENAPALPVVVWGLPAIQIPTEESEAEINRIFKEKGIACTVKFFNCGLNVDKENCTWLDKYLEKEGKMDILSTGSWLSQNGSAEFAKKYFLGLNQFLETEEGDLLRNTFCDVDWECVRVQGDIYTVPKIDNMNHYNQSVYLYVKDDYKEYFADFDGSFFSLMEIYDAMGQDAGKVYMEGSFSIIVNTFLGYQSYDQFPYDAGTNCIVDLSESEQVIVLLDEIFRRLQTGDLVDSKQAPFDPEHVVAYIRQGIAPEKEGFERQLLSQDLYTLKCGFTCGVLKSSEQKELALTVLSECYSNPRIYSILNPNMDEASMNERRELMAAEQPSKLTGYLPDFTDTQRSLWNQYSASLFDLVDGMYAWRGDTLVLAGSYSAKGKCQELSKESYKRFLSDWNELLKSQSDEK